MGKSKSSQGKTQSRSRVKISIIPRVWEREARKSLSRLIFQSSWGGFDAPTGQKKRKSSNFPTSTWSPNRPLSLQSLKQLLYITSCAGCIHITYAAALSGAFNNGIGFPGTAALISGSSDSNRSLCFCCCRCSLRSLITPRMLPSDFSLTCAHCLFCIIRERTSCGL